MSSPEHLSEQHKRNISKAKKGKPSPTKGMRLSEEHKKKISEARKGHPSSMLGKKHSKKAKKKMSLAHMGQFVSEETRKKLSITSSNISDEKRAKISEHSYFKKVGFRRGSTKTERKFARLHPELEREVIFGTGKNGRTLYGCSFFAADFYDREHKIVYEIDGESHKMLDRDDRDSRKDLFFADRKIKVIRIPNSQV